MTDKELLELAAKAAGIEFDYDPITDKRYVNRENIKGWFVWNPLTDDGDAFRLAVKLNMQILIGDGGMCHASSGWGGEVFSIHGKDHYTATRRAIVRAAAEIGKAMK